MNHFLPKYRREQRQTTPSLSSAVLGKDGKLRPKDNPGSSPPVVSGPAFKGIGNARPTDAGGPYLMAKKTPHNGNSY